MAFIHRLLERMWGTFNVGFWSWVNGIWEDLVPLDFILEMNQQVYEVRKDKDRGMTIALIYSFDDIRLSRYI